MSLFNGHKFADAVSDIIESKDSCGWDASEDVNGAVVMEQESEMDGTPGMCVNEPVHMVVWESVMWDWKKWGVWMRIVYGGMCGCGVWKGHGDIPCENNEWWRVGVYLWWQEWSRTMMVWVQMIPQPDKKNELGWET